MNDDAEKRAMREEIKRLRSRVAKLEGSAGGKFPALERRSAAEPEKVVFGIGDAEDGGKVLVIGVHGGAWEYMKDGMTHTLDLRVFGFPHRVILYGGRDRQAVIAMLPADASSIDVSGLDVGFGREA